MEDFIATLDQTLALIKDLDLELIGFSGPEMGDSPCI